jgi:hypothetical protein
MGLFAAAITSSFRLPAGTAARSRIQLRSLQVLIRSLLPLATTATSGHVDYGAHFGRALSSGWLALLMLKSGSMVSACHGIAVLLLGSRSVMRRSNREEVPANRPFRGIWKLRGAKIEQGIFEQVSGNYVGVIMEFFNSLPVAGFGGSSAVSRERVG